MWSIHRRVERRSWGVVWIGRRQRHGIWTDWIEVGNVWTGVVGHLTKTQHHHGSTRLQNLEKPTPFLPETMAVAVNTVATVYARNQRPNWWWNGEAAATGMNGCSFERPVPPRG